MEKHNYYNHPEFFVQVPPRPETVEWTPEHERLARVGTLILFLAVIAAFMVNLVIILEGFGVI